MGKIALRTAVGALLCAVGGGCSPADPGGADAATVRIGVAAPQQALEYHRGALTLEALVTTGPDGRPVPRIIESWERSSDGLTWRLKVRQGVKYHDGTPHSAGELAPQLQSTLASWSPGATVVAESANVLLITLKEPYGFFFEDLAGISPEHEVGGKSYGSGPYVAVEDSPERLVLEAFPGHYRGQPGVGVVDIRLFPDQRNAWSALMRDELDMLYEVNSDSLEFVRSESSIRVATFPRPYTYVFAFNLTHPALKDVRVRRALDLAVDRAAFVQTAMAGEGEPARGHVWPRHWAFDASANPIRYDPAAARRLLEEAGLRVKQEPGRMPSRLRLKCLVYAPMQKMALVVQRQLADIDVDLELEMPSPQEFVGRITTGNFESFVFEFASARGLKWPYQFWHSSSVLWKHGYRSADGVLDRMRHAPGDAEFAAAVGDFQRTMHDDPPAVFLAWGRISRAVTKRFDVPQTEEDIYHSLSRWTLAKKP